MKGQWFIISAVIASGVFLAISVLFRDYFLVDSSVTASINEDFYFTNIEDQLYSLKNLDNGCAIPAEYEQNYREFREFLTQKTAAMGYFLYINKTSSCPDPAFSIMLASERMTISKNVDAGAFLAP